MGKRPLDFDENLVRKAPTFRKWLQLEDGEKLRYACRDFYKGSPDGEERLMRRIMIARRNNIKDHEQLKRARRSEVVQRLKRNSNVNFYESITLTQGENKKTSIDATGKTPNSVPNDKDILVNDEMDVEAIENTRTYKKWKLLEDGQQLRYNQDYQKGKFDQDTLLRRNIWRRMKYRRESKCLIAKMNKGNRNESLKRFLHHPLPQQNIAVLEGTTSEIKIDQRNTTQDARFLSQYPNMSRHANMNISEKLQNFRTHLGIRGGHQGISHHNPHHPLGQNSLMTSASTETINTRVGNSFRNLPSFAPRQLPIPEIVKKHQLYNSNINYDFSNNPAGVSLSVGLKAYTSNNDGRKSNKNGDGIVDIVFDNRQKIPLTLNKISEESYGGLSRTSIDTQLKNSNFYSIHDSKISGYSVVQKDQKRDRERLLRHLNVSTNSPSKVRDDYKGIGPPEVSLSNGRVCQEKTIYFPNLERNLKSSVSCIVDDDVLMEQNLRLVVEEALGPIHFS